MEPDCIFCKIAAGQTETEFVHQDARVVAFDDTNPQAPHHVLIIPREHMDSLNDASQGDEATLGHVLRVAARIADQRGFGEDGFRVVINTGRSAGQSVEHVHAHLLGGRDLTWPPG